MLFLVATSRRPIQTASPSLRHAATLARDAAESIADERDGSPHSDRHRDLAGCLSALLDEPEVPLKDLIMASPRVIERSGRARSLVEMIEADPGDDAYRLRLARLLLRALDWDPYSFPRAET